METLKEVAVELHNTLNKKIWDEDTNLRPIVREKLLQITRQYAEDSEVLSYDDILDAEIVGSNASYNYTSHSDLDLHLVVSMENLSCDPALFQIACNAEKINFNKSYDIKVRGMEVELYVEDVKSSTASNGVYSVFENRWIKFPAKIAVPSFEDNAEYNSLLSEYKNKAEALLGPDASVKAINNYIDSLYTLRRSGIMVDGEFSQGNFIFKEIRNLGLLDELKARRNDLRSKELSVESLLVNNESINYNNSEICSIKDSRSFIELPSFREALDAYGLGDEFLGAVQNAIISNPEAGDMIPETGGARKLRFKVYNKGKSGGYCVIYVDFISDTVVYLITLYAKSVKTDLSKSEIRDIKRVVKGVK